MRSFFLAFLATVTALVAWTTLVFFGTLNGWLREPLAPIRDGASFEKAAIAKIDATYQGNIAFVLLENGEVRGSHFASIGSPVDGDTLFQVGSLSKWISAFGVLRLVQDGYLDLDEPVSTYLTRWQLPESEFDNDAVTVRHLLSHMAGLTDGLGYAGFAPDGDIQSLEQSLTLAADASPGADGKVRVGQTPGTAFMYSGGGYALLQLLVEEVSGEPFATYMSRAVFQPLNMERTTFTYPEDETPNLAESFDTDGSNSVRFRFTALAPVALYTTANDMTAFLQSHLRGQTGELTETDVLSPETLELMRTPHATQMGADVWGLGTILYAPSKEGGYVIGHDGNDEPAINSAARLNPASGNGIIILQTGNKLLATEIGGEWVFWETGKIDLLTFTMIIDDMIMIIMIGGGIILLFAIGIGFWRFRRRRVA